MLFLVVTGIMFFTCSSGWRIVVSCAFGMRAHMFHVLGGDVLSMAGRGGSQRTLHRLRQLHRLQA
jgi:hypothetical protein